MTEVVDTTPIVDSTPVAEDKAEVTSEDEASILTEVAAPPAESEKEEVKEEVKPEPKEEEKADAFIAAIMNLWAMLTGKVKEIDENAGISSKVAELDGEFKVSETLNNAKEATVKTISEWTNKGEETKKEEAQPEKDDSEKEWVEVDEKEE